jgi:hypothetical protein
MNPGLVALSDHFPNEIRLILHTSILNMKGAYSSRILVSTYKIRRYHNSEDHKLNCQHCEHLTNCLNINCNFSTPQSVYMQFPTKSIIHFDILQEM